MQKLSLGLMVCLILNACAPTHHPAANNQALQPGETRVSFTTSHHQAKPGNSVAFYAAKESLHRPYRVIGKEIVSRYDFIGLERKTRTLNDIMTRLAASMGGDAVININSDRQKVEGTVISYERVML